jgi:putative oxidoreductase
MNQPAPSPETPSAILAPAETHAQTAVYTLVRICVSGLFLMAAWTKLRDPNGTLIAVYQYQIISWENSEWVSIGLPWFEAVTACGLWFRRTRLGAHALLFAMLGIFLFALASAFARKLDVNCGCFGSWDSNRNVAVRLAEDLVLLAFCLPLFRRDARVR